MSELIPQFPEETTTGHVAWNDWPWKLHRINGTKYELYNLADDPRQQHDLASEQPERVERLKAKLLEINASVMADGADWHLK